jgi:hypothetical protein
LRVSVDRVGGLTVREPATLLEPTLAVTVAATADATAVVVVLKLA